MGLDEEQVLQTRYGVSAPSPGQTSQNPPGLTASRAQVEVETLVRKVGGKSKTLQTAEPDQQDEGIQVRLPSGRGTSLRRTQPTAPPVKPQEASSSVFALLAPAEMIHDVPRELRVDGWVQPVMVIDAGNGTRMLRSHRVAPSTAQPDSANVQASGGMKSKEKANENIKGERKRKRKRKMKTQGTELPPALGPKPDYYSDSNSTLTSPPSDLSDGDHGKAGTRIQNTGPAGETPMQCRGQGTINRGVEPVGSGTSSISLPTNPPVEPPNQKRQTRNMKPKQLSPSAQQLHDEATVDSSGRRNKRQKVIHVTSRAGINTTSAASQKKPTAKGKEKMPATMEISNPPLNELSLSQQNQQKNKRSREPIAEQARTRSGRLRPVSPIQMEVGESSNAPHILARRTRNGQVPPPPSLPKSRKSTTHDKNNGKHKRQSSSAVSKPKRKGTGRSDGKGRQSGKDHPQALPPFNPVDILAKTSTASKGDLLLSIGRGLLNLEIPGGIPRAPTLGRFLDDPEKRFMASAGDEYNPSQGLDYTWTLGNTSTVPGRGVGKRQFGRKSQKEIVISFHDHDHEQTLNTPAEGCQLSLVDEQYPQLMAPDGKGYRLGDNERVQNGGRLFGEEAEVDERKEEQEHKKQDDRAEPRERNAGYAPLIRKGPRRSKSSSKSSPPLSPFSQDCFDACIQMG